MQIPQKFYPEAIASFVLNTLLILGYGLVALYFIVALPRMAIGLAVASALFFLIELASRRSVKRSED